MFLSPHKTAKLRECTKNLSKHKKAYKIDLLALTYSKLKFEYLSSPSFEIHFIGL